MERPRYKAVEPSEEPGIARAQQLLGHTFADTALLAAALRHPSYSGDATGGMAFQRLEFLGDAVLDAVVVAELFERFPDSPEGALTKLKVTLVSGPTLAELMRETGLDALLLLGPSELRAQGRGMTSALSDCFEALVAALYLDSGMEAVRAFVLPALTARISGGPEGAGVEHPKSALQEIAQADGHAPHYETVGEHGPPHDRRFAVRVLLNGREVGRGEGRSKKEAEMQAAAEALKGLRGE